MEYTRSFLIWITILIVVTVTTLLSIAVYYNWQASAQVQEQLSAIRTAGDPAELEDLKRRPLPPEQNAAAALRKAEPGLRAIERQLQANLYQTTTYTQGTYSEQNYQAISAALSAHPDVVPLIEEAAALPRYDPQLDYSLDPNKLLEANIQELQVARSAVRVMRERIALLIYEGEHDEALRSSLLLFRLSRHLDNHPTITGYMVALACRGIAADAAARVLMNGEVSSDLRAALDQELARHDGMDGYISALKTERAFASDRFRSMTGGVASVMKSPMKKQHVAFLDRIAAELQLGTAPAYEVSDELNALNAKTTAQGSFVALAVPSLTTTREAMDRTRAHLRALRVLNAIQARSIAQNELDLAELNLPPNATTDPFTGAPLLVIRSPDGWTVYSVGPNLQDDGGQLGQNQDIGIGPVR